jgi:hypothetical protein
VGNVIVEGKISSDNNKMKTPDEQAVVEKAEKTALKLASR